MSLSQVSLPTKRPPDAVNQRTLVMQQNEQRPCRGPCGNRGATAVPVALKARNLPQACEISRTVPARIALPGAEPAVLHCRRWHHDCAGLMHAGSRFHTDARSRSAPTRTPVTPASARVAVAAHPTHCGRDRSCRHWRTAALCANAAGLIDQRRYPGRPRYSTCAATGVRRSYERHAQRRRWRRWKPRKWPGPTCAGSGICRTGVTCCAFTPD